MWFLEFILKGEHVIHRLGNLPPWTKWLSILLYDKSNEQGKNNKSPKHFTMYCQGFLVGSTKWIKMLTIMVGRKGKTFKSQWLKCYTKILKNVKFRWWKIIRNGIFWVCLILSEFPEFMTHFTTHFTSGRVTK